MASNMSTIKNGESGSRSYDFILEDEIRRRKSDSWIGWNSLKTESVEGKEGGDEPAVESRQRMRDSASFEKSKTEEPRWPTNGVFGYRSSLWLDPSSERRLEPVVYTIQGLSSTNRYCVPHLLWGFYCALWPVSFSVLHVTGSISVMLYALRSKPDEFRLFW